MPGSILVKHPHAYAAARIISEYNPSYRRAHESHVRIVSGCESVSRSYASASAILFLNDSGSEGSAINTSSLFPTTSSAPTELLATTGTPHANASSTTRPNGSESDGQT